MKIIWRVAGRGQLDEGFERIAQTLAQGYDNLAFDGVTIVEMTAPAGATSTREADVVDAVTAN